MSTKDVTGNIKVIKLRGVGTALKGIDELFLKAKEKNLGEEELVKFLVDGVKKYNALSRRDEELLKEVLPKKFQSYLKGEPEEKEEKPWVDIKILGNFTPNFFELEKQAMQAVVELDVEGPFLQVDDPEKMAEYGNIPKPALVINEKVVSSGRVIMKEEIKSLILEAIQKYKRNK